MFALSALMGLRAAPTTTTAITWPPLSPSANTKRIKLTVIKKKLNKLNHFNKER
jgi:hypothetical protein